MNIPAARRPETAFTLVEIMISTTIVVMAMGAALVFTESVNRSLANISTQSKISADVAGAAGFLAQRIRVATFASVSTNGNILYLAFDDNLSTDSNTNGNKYDDRDHYESFKFQSIDGSEATLTDNQFIYTPKTNETNVVILLPGNFRKITGTNLFSLDQSNRVVNVNFGALDKADGRRSQTIEIRTSFVRRNR